MKVFKKALAFFLSLAMILGVLANTGLDVNAATSNKVTVYYNTSWGQPNIHYQTANGSWTSLPGVKMTKSNELGGYNWKATIDLGSKSSTLVCFNDGNNHWDSQNGKNYTVYAGRYGIKDGSVTKYSDTVRTPECDFTVSDNQVVVGKEVSFKGSVNADFDTHRYNNYEYTIAKNGKTIDTINCGMCCFDASYTFAEAGTYTVTFEASEYVTHDTYTKTKTVTVVDNRLKVTKLTADVASPQKVGTAISLSAAIENEVTYQGSTRRFTVKKVNGSEEVLTNHMQTYATWTPAEAGDYVITFYVKDSSGAEATKTMNYTITDNNKSNCVAVYYANKSFGKANAHYKVGNGSWTAVPGEAMSVSSELGGYTWKIVIDLGSATSATICFNDGNNHWDSQNGKNYTVYAGRYGIKDGSVTKYSDTVRTPECDFTVSDKQVVVGKEVSFKGSVNTDFDTHRYNNYEYTIAKNGKTIDTINCGMCCFDASYTFAEAGTYTVTFEASEYVTHDTYTKTKTVTVVDK